MRTWVLFVLLAALPLSGTALGGKEKRNKKNKQGAATAASLEDRLSEAKREVAAGNAQGAIKILRKAVALPEANGEPSLLLGRLLQGQMEFDSAIDAYKTAAQKLGDNPKKGEALGRQSLLLALRGMAGAPEAAEQAAAADPDGYWPLVALARLRATQGEGDEALSLAQRAVAARDGPAAQSAVGFAETARGNMDEAEVAFRAALVAEPQSIDAGVGLARVLRTTKRAADAEPILRGVLDKAPGAVSAYKESARVKMASNRLDEAAADAAIAAAMGEADPEAQRILGEVTVAKAAALLSTGHIDGAIQGLTRYKNGHPDFAPARLALGKALLLKREADAALAELEQAVELEPGLAEAHDQMGMVHLMLKQDAPAAVACYEKAVAAEPADVSYRTNLGAALVATKQYDRAVEELTRATGEESAPATAWIYLGRAHLGAGRYRQALPPLEQAVSRAPESADAWASLSWCHFGLKDTEAFKKHARKAKALGHKEPTLLGYLERVEAGEPIK